MRAEELAYEAQQKSVRFESPASSRAPSPEVEVLKAQAVLGNRDGSPRSADVSDLDSGAPQRPSISLAKLRRFA